MQHKQHTFTLREVSIAMLIMGIFISATIKMYEFIENSKAESLARDFNHIQIALLDYRDRLHVAFAKDPVILTHLETPVPTAHNGSIAPIVNETWNSTSGESFNVWQRAQITEPVPRHAGKPSDMYVPLTLSGDTQAPHKLAFAPITGLTSQYIICSDNIAGSLVKRLDLLVDDGNTLSGSMRAARASIGGTAIATSSIADSAGYLACMGV